jgi:YHS domain-containing protein
MHRILNAALFAIALSPLTAAAQQVPQVNTDSAGVAILGYDPVAYFTDAKAVVGKPEFTARHDGATWQFASAAHRDAFVANPARYAPQFGGYCAYGVAGNY